MHNTDEWERTKPRIRHPRYGPKLLSYLRMHCANEGSKTEGRLTEGKGIRIHANAGSLWENWRPGLQAGISPTPTTPSTHRWLSSSSCLSWSSSWSYCSVALWCICRITKFTPTGSRRRVGALNGAALCAFGPDRAPDRAISTRSPASPTLDNTICSIMNLSRKCILPMPSEWQGLFGR